jgi:hypothetical protein
MRWSVKRGCLAPTQGWTELRGLLSRRHASSCTRSFGLSDSIWGLRILIFDNNPSTWLALNPIREKLRRPIEQLQPQGTAHFRQGHPLILEPSE